MRNFRAVIDRGYVLQGSLVLQTILLAEAATATIRGGRAVTSLHRTPSLESYGAETGSRTPRSEPAASEPSETEALPPAAAGSLNGMLPGPRPSEARTRREPRQCEPRREAPQGER